MPKRIAAALALLALTLTGCTGTPDSAPSEPEAVVVESPAPLVAEESPAVHSTDAAFLAYVRENLLPETQIPNATDEQLIAAGHDACDQLAAGTASEDVRVVDGEQAHEVTGFYYDSIAIRNGASRTFCPDLG